MTHSIEVENIKCGGCMNTIKTALSKINGVSEVNIDLNQEMVEVAGDVDKELLLNELARLGYPEKGNNNLLHKAKSYVSCAIGRIN